MFSEKNVLFLFFIFMSNALVLIGWMPVYWNFNIVFILIFRYNNMNKNLCYVWPCAFWHNIHIYIFQYSVHVNVYTIYTGVAFPIYFSAQKMHQFSIIINDLQASLFITYNRVSLNLLQIFFLFLYPFCIFLYLKWIKKNVHVLKPVYCTHK